MGDRVLQRMQHHKFSETLGQWRDSIQSQGMAFLQRWRVEQELRTSLQRNELALALQPIVSLVDGHLISREALVRWEKPKEGTLMPTTFLPLFEEFGLSTELDQWVLTQACYNTLLRNQRCNTRLSIHVNLSGQQFHIQGLSQRVHEALRLTGLEPHLLCLEITEGQCIQDIDAAVSELQQLRDWGVQIWLDDFGTGYNGLLYLQELPLDGIKIALPLIHRLSNTSSSALIVKSCIDLAHSIGLKVVGEGIETLEQLQQLRAFGCDMGQGFLFQA